MQFIKNFIRRIKVNRILKDGELLYKNKHLKYNKTADSIDLYKFNLSQLDRLRERYIEARVNSLDYGIYFDNFEPYVIIDDVRYNLKDEVLYDGGYKYLRTNPYFKKESELKRKTLAEVLLPANMVIVLPWKKIIEDKDHQLLVTIKPFNNPTNSQWI